MTRTTAGHVAIVGSGLAGLAAALEAARAGARVTVLTPARAGRDGSSHRVHALAPWILLTAPWVRGDSPRRFLEDLRRNGGGLQRDAVTAAFAERAHAGAVSLIEALGLERIGEPVEIPGDAIARGQRCLPARTPMLAALVAACSDLGVEVRERSLAVGLLKAGDRAAGVVYFDRSAGANVELAADAVILACGGVGAVFPRTTAPRWCRGSALAIGSAAGALLHRPNLTQAIPVTATPPLYFPTTAAILRGRILLGQRPLQPKDTLDEATAEIARALRQGEAVTLEPVNEDGAALLPQRVRETAAFAREKRVPLAIAVHHAVGGIAIDAHGRTSLAGLYACGEAAGGVQGRRRLMGTGLLEAWIFGGLAGRAAAVEAGRQAGDHGRPADRAVVAGGIPVESRVLDAALDRCLAPLTCLRPVEEVAAALAELERLRPQAAPAGSDAAWLAAIRRAAAVVILQAEIAGAEVTAATDAAEGGGER